MLRCHGQFRRTSGIRSSVAVKVLDGMFVIRELESEGEDSGWWGRMGIPLVVSVFMGCRTIWVGIKYCLIALAEISIQSNCKDRHRKMHGHPLSVPYTRIRRMIVFFHKTMRGLSCECLISAEVDVWIGGLTNTGYQYPLVEANFGMFLS